MNKTLLWVIIILIVAVALFLIFGGTAEAPQEQGEDDEIVQDEPIFDDDVNTTPTISYTNTGYSPSNVTIETGGTVTFINNSGSEMWTASAVHPTHEVYAGTTLNEHCSSAGNTSFDACEGIAPGESWSFTFTKTGTWGYHNHLRPTHTGRVTVE